MLRKIVLAATFLALASGVASAQVRRASVEILPSSSQLKPGESGQLAIRFKIQPSWHLYWLNPGETGMPPRVEWKSPPGVKIGELQFPVPKRIGALGEPVSFGYEKELVLIADISVDDKAPAGPLQIEADLSWLVCQDVCISESGKTHLKLEVGNDGKADERFDAWRSAIPKPDPAVKYSVELSSDQTTGRLVAALPPEVRSVDLFPPAMDFAEYGVPRRATEDGADVVVVQFRVLPGLKETKSGDAVLAYTNKDGRRIGVVLPTEFKFSK